MAGAKYVLLLVASIVGLIHCSEKCGKWDPKKQGSNWPWLVTVYGDGQMRCMGTLVEKDRIITAARCVDPEDYPSKDWQVGLSDGTKVVVEKVFMHQEFVKKTDMSSDIAILNLKEPITVTDTLMPVCKQEKGKEEKMTNCQTVHIVPDIDDPTGGEHENIASKNVDHKSCKANTNKNLVDKNVSIKKESMKDLLCVKMDRTINEPGKGCSRQDVSPLYCNEAKKWYLSGIALSCGHIDMPIAKSNYAWYVDVCNCMDDMIPSAQQEKEEEASGDQGEEEEEEDDVASGEEEEETKEEEEKEEKKAEAKKENKKDKKKESKKVNKDKKEKKMDKRKKQMKTMGWAKKKGEKKQKGKKEE